MKTKQLLENTTPQEIIFLPYTPLQNKLNTKRKKTLYFSKAFDSLWRTGLGQKLLNSYVNGKFIKVLQKCIEIISNHANSTDSLFFFSNRGVSQGDTISPILFLFFLNDFENYLHADKIKGIPVECNIDNLYFFTKMYVIL